MRKLVRKAEEFGLPLSFFPLYIGNFLFPISLIVIYLPDIFQVFHLDMAYALLELRLLYY